MPDVYGAAEIAERLWPAVQFCCSVMGKAGVCAGDSGRAGGRLPLVWTRSARRLGRPENPLLGSATAAAHMQSCEMSKLLARTEY